MIQPVVQMGIIVVRRYIALAGAYGYILRGKIILIIGDARPGNGIVREIAQVKIYVAYPCGHLRAADRDRRFAGLHFCFFFSLARHRYDHPVIGAVEAAVRIGDVDRILRVVQILQDQPLRRCARRTRRERKYR